MYGVPITAALSIGDKHERGRAVSQVEDKISAFFSGKSASATKEAAGTAGSSVGGGGLKSSIAEKEADSGKRSVYMYYLYCS